MHDYAERMNRISASGQTFREKLVATVTSHVTKYREKNEALRVYNAERLYLPESKRTKLKELGTGYRQQLEKIFAEGIENGEVESLLTVNSPLTPSLECVTPGANLLTAIRTWTFLNSSRIA